MENTNVRLVSEKNSNEIKTDRRRVVKDGEDWRGFVPNNKILVWSVEKF